MKLGSDRKKIDRHNDIICGCFDTETKYNKPIIETYPLKPAKIKSIHLCKKKWNTMFNFDTYLNMLFFFHIPESAYITEYIKCTALHMICRCTSSTYIPLSPPPKKKMKKSWHTQVLISGNLRAALTRCYRYLTS